MMVRLYLVRYVSKSERYSDLLWPTTISTIANNSLYGVHIPMKQNEAILKFTIYFRSDKVQTTNFAPRRERVSCKHSLIISRYGCQFKYLMVSQSYGLSKSDEALNLKQRKFYVRDNGNNSSHFCKIAKYLCFPIVLAIVQSTSLFGSRFNAPSCWGDEVLTDPFVLTNCVSALLIANQRWGSHCHAHRCYCFVLLFSTVKLICI